MKNKFSISVCIPVYKGSNLIKDALDSLYSQDGFNDLDIEIIVGEDTNPDLIDEINKTKKILDKYNNPKITYIKNETNIGYARNLKNITSKAKNDILILLGQDDVLLNDALLDTYNAFLISDDIGAVTRPYYWFTNDINTPVRVVSVYDPDKTAVISINKKDQFLKIFESVGQFSGLAYKKSLISIPFNEECFPAHIYPFASILLKYKCAFLNKYTVAIGIKDSQTRNVSSIYDDSPTLSWLKMYKTLFGAKEYASQLNCGYEHILTNYIGLIQLKNYANKGVLFREIMILIKNRKRNLISLKFWFFALLTVLTPRSLLRQLTDLYKEKLNKQLIPHSK